MKNKLCILFALGCLLFAGCQENFDPVAYEAPEAMPLTGTLAPNDALEAAEKLGANLFNGSEDVAPSADGRLYGGNEGGDIVRLALDGSGRAETVANTGGRPLGLDFDPDGNLVIADSLRGLLRLNLANGEIETLSTTAEGGDFNFTDDVDVARDGTIYFSDASSKWGQEDYMLDALEGRAWGRLLRYDPDTKKTEVLLRDLYFANGVALSANEDFVLVNETWRFRVIRYWLKGPRAGTSETFIRHLPGYPDGISSDGRGTFWVALFTIRNPAADFLSDRPALRDFTAALPPALWPKPEPYGFALGLNERGEVLHALQDQGGDNVRGVTSVEAGEDALYLGTLEGAGVWRLPIPIGTSPRVSSPSP